MIKAGWRGRNCPLKIIPSLVRPVRGAVPLSPYAMGGWGGRRFYDAGRCGAKQLAHGLLEELVGTDAHPVGQAEVTHGTVSEGGAVAHGEATHGYVPIRARVFWLDRVFDFLERPNKS